MRLPAGAALLVLGGLPACSSCGRVAGAGDGDGDATSAGSSPSGSASVVAEVLPRCRASTGEGSAKLAFGGDDVVVGDVAVGPDGLLVGVIRVDGGKHVGAVVRASLDLATSQVVDVGPAFGDDPPPSPRWNGNASYVAFLGPASAGDSPSASSGRGRALRVAELGEHGLGKAFAPALQQADESTAFDVAWSDTGALLAAWDEDAPPRPPEGGAGTPASPSPSPEQLAKARGFVKVQVLAPEGGAAPERRVASPETSDADSPKLVGRPAGFWLGWLARRVVDDEPRGVEGPGESRTLAWVEVVALDAKGEPAGPVRRVSPVGGRAVAFELARSGPDVVVLVQDEAAPSEGAGGRVARYRVSEAGVDKERADSGEIVDAGVGQSLAELVPAASGGVATSASSANGGAPSRWLAWSDTGERAYMTPLGPTLAAIGRASAEPALDGARVVAHAPPDAVYALVTDADRGEGGHAKPEIRRLVCR